MLLKWTARAFAAGAALHMGVAAAQDDPLLIPPGQAGAEAQAGDTVDVPEQDAPEVNEAIPDARLEASEDVQEAREEAIEREARFAPNAASADQPIVDDRIRAATEGLNIDDETRSRYRWHNGEWWFKTRSGQWKFYREGQWQDFDPTTYEALTPGGASYAPQAGGTYAAPQTFSSGGYYYDNRPYSSSRPYRYGSSFDRYDGRIYGGTRFYDGRYDGRYYNPGYNGPGYGYRGAYGTGYRGYDPGTDRYYGRGPYGGGYSIDGDRYRGGVIGSEIGGRIGGRSGAILGGAIGAEAAD